MSKNDITGDEIRTGLTSEQYRRNYDIIFSKPKVAVIAWPDGTWCYRDEYLDGEYSHKSDDWRTYHLDARLDEYGIDSEILKLTGAVI